MRRRARHPYVVGGHSGRCHYCDQITYPSGSQQALADRNCMATRDHKIPRIFGGERGPIVLACAGCNEARGSVPYEIFGFYMERVGRTQQLQARKKGIREFVALLMVAGFTAARREAARRRPRPKPSSIKDILENLRGAA